jgi:uncharacterized protein
MQTEAAHVETSTAIQTDLAAIFISLELSRSIWLITSLSPGNGAAGARKRLRHAEADPAIASGDNRNASGEIEIACHGKVLPRVAPHWRQPQLVLVETNAVRLGEAKRRRLQHCAPLHKSGRATALFMAAICASRRHSEMRRFDPLAPKAYSPYMESAGPQLRIFVDADACPVKDEVYRVAARYRLTVFVVANSPIVIPRAPEIERVVVGAGPDAADDWIAERAGPGAIVVTSDIPLASRSVKSGADVIAPNGKRFSESSIGMALATRNLMDHLRSTGQATSGPKAFGPRDRSNFLSALDNAVVRLQRLATTR